MAIRYVLLDFDGTCTQIDRAHAGFLTTYRQQLEIGNGLKPDALAGAWTKAHDDVVAASPYAGWTLLDVPSTAPAAADPYILSGEIAKLLVRRKQIKVVPADAYNVAYTANQAPWRPEVKAVLSDLVSAGVRVAFVSNSSTTTLKNRLDDLLCDAGDVRSKIEVAGGASKFMVQELLLDAFPAGTQVRRLFERLPGTEPIAALRRPVYLRRAYYFDAIFDVLGKLAGGKPPPLAQVMVCGDIYELDLAMPKALGMPVHLITRVAPYKTYRYELAAVPKDAVSDDLTGLVKRIKGVTARRP